MEETSKVRGGERTQNLHALSECSPLLPVPPLSEPHPLKMLRRPCYIGMIDLIISYL